MARRDVAAMVLFADPKPNAPAQRSEDPARVFDAVTVAPTAEFQAVLKLHNFGVLNGTRRRTTTDLARFPGTRAASTPLLGLALDTLLVSPTSGQREAGQGGRGRRRGGVGKSRLVYEFIHSHRLQLERTPYVRQGNG
jgi:hypothetical protein